MEVTVEVGDSVFLPTLDDLVDETKEGCIEHAGVVRISSGDTVKDMNHWKMVSAGKAVFQSKDGEETIIWIRSRRVTFHFIDVG